MLTLVLWRQLVFSKRGTKISKNSRILNVCLCLKVEILKKKILENAKNKVCHDLSLLMKTHIFHIFSPIKLWNLRLNHFLKHLLTFFVARKIFEWLKFMKFSWNFKSSHSSKYGKVDCLLVYFSFDWKYRLNLTRKIFFENFLKLIQIHLLKVDAA